MVSLDAAQTRNYWLEIVRKTFRGGFTGDNPFIILKSGPAGVAIPSPERSGGVLFRHLGELKGQVADWRASIDGTDAGFHCVEYDDRYECHIDAKDPIKDPVGHLAVDSPGTLAAIGVIAAVGAIAAIAYALTREDD